MNHTILMQILDYVRDFLHDGSRLSLRKEFLFEDFVQQLSASHQLEHEVDLVLLLEHVPEADDVRVLAVPEEDLNLLLAVPFAPVITGFSTCVLFSFVRSSRSLNIRLSAFPFLSDLLSKDR